MRQKNYSRYFAFLQLGLVEGKILPAVPLSHEAKQTQPFSISKIEQKNFYYASEAKALSYFAVKRVQLLRLVK